MSTIALYATQISQMPTLFQNLRNSVIDYQAELASLKANVLTISNSVCNMEEVISSIQASTQTQEQKNESLDLLDKKNKEFVYDVIAIDSEVSEVISRRKQDFYATYAYLKPECEKNWLEKARDWFFSASVFCREHWKEIATVILVIAAIAVVIWCPGIALLMAMAKGILMGATIGGLIGGVMSAWRGGSFWEGLVDGAFTGAVSGMIAGGMSFAYAKVGFNVLTLKQTMLVGGVTGAATPAISDLGDIIIKGENISLGQVLKDVVIGGVLGAAFAGIGYGIGKVFKALKMRFTNGVENGSDTVTYRRVQGGSGNNASQVRIQVNEDGTIYIANKDANLSISIDNGEHAQYFLNKRGGDASIVEVEVPKWFDDFLQENAIPQFNYSNNPLNQGGTAPKITDITTPGNSFELPAPWIEWFEELGSNARIVHP